MSDSIGQKTEKLSRVFGDMLEKQEQIKESKKALKQAMKDSEDGEIKVRLKELKDTRKGLSAEIRDLQEELERLSLENNPDIKDLRERVLEIEEEEANLKAEVRELSTPLLEKNPVLELDVRAGDVPTKVHLMRSVVVSVNGREQSL